MAKECITIHKYSAPCGELILGSIRECLCICDWMMGRHRNLIDNRLKHLLNAEFKEGMSATIENAIAQLDEYFAGLRREFDIPLLFAGSDFQKSVWKSLMAIPYGKTISYGEQALRIGRPKYVRAVANANGANAISIFVPCHRVIGSNHSLTGYGGGIEAKAFLLNLESRELPPL